MTANDIIERAMSIFMTEPDLDVISMYNLMRMMSEDMEICDESKDYAAALKRLFNECGYDFSTDKKADQLSTKDGMIIFTAFEEYVAGWEGAMEDALSCLEALRERYREKDFFENLVHFGDCTKIPCSCEVCCQLSHLEDLSKFISMLTYGGVSVIRS